MIFQAPSHKCYVGSLEGYPKLSLFSSSFSRPDGLCAGAPCLPSLNEMGGLSAGVWSFLRAVLPRVPGFRQKDIIETEGDVVQARVFTYFELWNCQTFMASTASHTH